MFLRKGVLKICSKVTEEHSYRSVISIKLQNILIMKHLEAANSSFVFETVTNEKIEKLVTNLNIRKAAQSNDIPTKLVKEFGYLFSKYIATSINRCIAEGTFVNVFKGAMKLYLTYCYCAIIILFNTGLYKSVFSTYPFKKRDFFSLRFWCFCVF